MPDMFLQEAEATLVNFDLRAFTMIAAHLGPVELGGLLSRFYTHAEEAIEAGGGRLVKFMSDEVMSVFVEGQHGGAHGGHRQGALAAIRHAQKTRAAWLDENQKVGLPLLGYSMAAASGKVLVGSIGTAKQHAFDVLGVPANVVFKLTEIATTRDLDNLVTGDVVVGAAGGTGGVPADAVEVEPFALGGKRYRLYHVG
jgi:class 3 adenylate cyclase